MSNMLLSSIIWCEQVDYGLNLQEIKYQISLCFPDFQVEERKFTSNNSTVQEKSTTYRRQL